MIVFGWSHARRKFFEIHKAHKLPLAGEMLGRIGELYANEERNRGLPAAARASQRQEKAKPVLEGMKRWLGGTALRDLGQEPAGGSDALRARALR